MSTLSYVLDTPLTPNPDWPSGYSEDLTFDRHTFDFGRNWFYAPISGSGQAGVVVKDLSTMHVIKTPTSNQMYAGTPFGVTPGVPWIQGFNTLRSGNNTDLFAVVQVDVFHNYFTRINPVTTKVTGEIISNMPASMDAVNTTAARTIVAGTAGATPGFYDGTAVAFLGLGLPTLYNNYVIIPGAKHPDGSCDFLLFDADNSGSTGNVDIWRINVSNSLTITSTKTGTLHALPIIGSAPHLAVTEAEYDVTHDRMILWLNTGAFGTGATTWIVSVNYDGTVNWVYTGTEGGSSYNKGQSQLTGTTLMIGDSSNLHLINTSTGAITFTGSILVAGTPAGSFFKIWDAGRNAYWTYAPSRGFVRIDVVPDYVPLPPKLWLLRHPEHWFIGA